MIRFPRPPHTGLGTLTQARALSLHAAGVSRLVIALEAGVTVGGVDVWRRRHGLTRAWKRSAS